MEISIQQADVDDAEEISKIWEIICAKKIYTSVSHPFTPEQERKYILSLSEREGFFQLKQKAILLVSKHWINGRNSHNILFMLRYGTFIFPEWRRKGIGSKLTRYTLSFARDHNYEKIVIYARPGYYGVITFYKSLGFLQKGVLSRQVKINNQYKDEIFMELFLYF
jgi:GNAT superfamily N-acetyltransferase